MDILLALLLLIFLIIIWIILFDTSRFTVTNLQIHDERIKTPLRAVVLSDLHNKKYGMDNSHLLWRIDEEKPDIIITAGDIPTAHPREKLDIAEGLIESLAKKYPVFYGMGNHEHRMQLYPEAYGSMWQEYKSFLDGLENVTLLDNTSVDLSLLSEETDSTDQAAKPNESQRFASGIRITGSKIGRDYYKRFGVQDMDSAYLDQELGKVDPECFNILIAHNPDYFPKYAVWGADLVLSGHVHGGIVQIPFWHRGCASPNIRLFPWYDSGIFAMDKQDSQAMETDHRKWPRGNRLKEINGDFRKNSRMYLNRGLGMHTIPIRLFNPGELVVIDFMPEK